METSSEIENYINGWLPYLPPYGAFTYPERPKELPKNTEDVKRAVKNIVNDAFMGHGMAYLISNGFVVPRYDIKIDDLKYYEMTERGRTLKGLGSIGAFNVDFENNNRRKALQDRRVDYLYWINFWIAVGAVSAALYYLLEIVLEITKHRFHMPDINLFFCGCVFLSGILTGIAILLLAIEVLHRINRE